MGNLIALGCFGEDAACSYLEQQGYQILARNFRCKMGEIDIVAAKGEIIAFVEVKTRQSLLYGAPCEAVTWKKQRHIIKTASYYIHGNHRLDSRFSYRFDVIEVIVAGDITEFLHIEGAFEV